MSSFVVPGMLREYYFKKRKLRKFCIPKNVYYRRIIGEVHDGFIVLVRTKGCRIAKCISHKKIFNEKNNDVLLHNYLVTLQKETTPTMKNSFSV
jgi:hypothetical protein